MRASAWLTLTIVGIVLSFVVVNAAIDILIAFVDPRIRFRART